MALWGEMRREQPQRRWQWQRLVQYVRLVPEASALLGLLAIAWTLGFPPAVGIFALAIIAYFGLRATLLALAEQQLARGSYTRADQLAGWTLRFHPWSVDALVLRAQIWTERGDDEAAEQLLRRAIELAPGDRAVGRALAAALMAQGRIAEGWQLASANAAHDPRSPQVAQQRAWFALHVEDNPAKARMLIVDATPDRYPSRIALPLLTTLVEAQIALGMRADAEHTLQTIEAQISVCPLPQQAELLYHLGRLHHALGQDGTPYFRRSLDRDPQGRYAQAAWRQSVDPAA